MPEPMPDGTVLKRYSGALTASQASKLRELHSAFIEDLSSVGILIPETSLSFEENRRGRLAPRIQQAAFEEHEIGRRIVRDAAPELVLKSGQMIVRDALNFLMSDLPTRRGFHPTFRNYAFRDGSAYMIDTFPPYASEKETKELMIRHAPSAPARLAMRLSGPFMHMFIEEYYNPVCMLSGLAGTVRRARPAVYDDFRVMLLDECSKVRFPKLTELESSISDATFKGHRYKLSDILAGRQIHKDPRKL